MGSFLSITTAFSYNDCLLPSSAASTSSTPNEIVSSSAGSNFRDPAAKSIPVGRSTNPTIAPEIIAGIPSVPQTNVVDKPLSVSSTKSVGDVHIRILRLQPPPWYLCWLPRRLQSMLPLRGTLGVQSLEDIPYYNALSYSWGVNEKTHSILINGSALAITPSLSDALVHLRPKTKALPIWIDQICINQSDDCEKTAQVKIMDRIYRSASEGLIWLGASANDSDALMDIFLKMGKFAEDFELLKYYTRTEMPKLHKIIIKENLDDPATRKYHEYCDKILPTFTPRFYRSLIALYQRQWFTRVWVMQEFALLPKATFVCGSRKISAEILMVVLSMVLQTMTSKVLDRSPTDKEMVSLVEKFNSLNSFQPFFASRRRRKARDEGRIGQDGLYELLQKVYVDNCVQATMGCDMVYGLLALTSDNEELGIVANYEGTNKDADEVFTRTAKAIIKSGKVDLLIFAQHIKKDMHLPSWVPDWRSEVRRSFAREYSEGKVDVMAAAIDKHLEGLGKMPSWAPDWRCEIQRSFAWLREEPSERKRLFSACSGLQLGGKELKMIETAGFQDLPLMGYRVDKVEMVAGPWSGDEYQEPIGRFPHEKYINYLSQIRQLCQISKSKGADIYKSEERRDQAVWRIPVGDIEQDETARALRATPSWKLAYDKCCAELELQMQWKALESFEKYKKRLKEVEEMPGKSSDYRIRMLEMRGKRPLLSNIGYVGMGPSCMWAGDEIVLFVGATLPFVVRPVGEGQFRLLGECYVDGIMDGEIVKSKMRGQENIILV